MAEVDLVTALRIDLPPYLRSLIDVAGRMGADRGEEVYLAGGSVRDLLLRNEALDVDLLVVGDGLAFAQKMSRIIKGELTRFDAFQTARIVAPDGGKVDVATARLEQYPESGALPRVHPGTLQDDLARRDFTINAMAIDLGKLDFGRLYDPFNGVSDLHDGIIRILHERSFVDDPTRIFRALRFSQRFGFRLATATDTALVTAVQRDRLEMVSGDRLRREVAAILSEEPVAAGTLLANRGVLASISLGLTADRETVEAVLAVHHWFQGLRVVERAAGGEADPWTLVLAAMARSLSQPDRWNLVERLQLSRQERIPLIEAGAAFQQARGRWGHRRGGSDRASIVDNLFQEIATPALIVGAGLATVDGEAELASALHMVLEQTRWVQPMISGKELVRLGCPEGPEIGRILRCLREAWLDGRVVSRQDEEQLARTLVGDAQSN